MMSHPLSHVSQSRQVGTSSSPPKAVILREEFVALTHDPLIAIVLNQLLYWTLRVKDFDLFVQEERFFNPECTIPPRHGWIYKTAHELIEETMIRVDRTTMRRYLKTLMDRGWLEERSHPKHKWDKTSQYRLNLRNLQEDLLSLGFELPGIDHLLQKEFLHKSDDEDELSNSSEMAELSKGDFAPSRENFTLSKGENTLYLKKSEENSMVQNAPSNGDISPSSGYASQSREKIDPSNVTNSPLYIQRLYTENKDRDHTRHARARENFSPLEKVQVGESGVHKAKHASIAQDMVDLWERHIVQKLFPKHWQGTLQLSETRQEQLELLFAFHFKNDLHLWERFCLRVRSTPFLMGGGSNGWKITLDWVLKEGNLRKILEGNYDNFHRREDEEDGSTLDNFQPDPACDAEKAAILGSIKDPIWKEWCTKLAAGVRLNDLRMLHEPLSAFNLRAIANAHFLECEDERLVWIGSSNPSVLRKIEDLRLKISWVFAKKYPKATTIRTRLESSSPIHGDRGHE